MKLVDKIQEAHSNKLSDYSKIYTPTAEVIERIADEFAIDFCEWIAINDYRLYSNGWSKVFKKGNITSKEILEIYKKEKGL